MAPLPPTTQKQPRNPNSTTIPASKKPTPDLLNRRIISGKIPKLSSSSSSSNTMIAILPHQEDETIPLSSLHQPSYIRVPKIFLINNSPFLKDIFAGKQNGLFADHEDYVCYEKGCSSFPKEFVKEDVLYVDGLMMVWCSMEREGYEELFGMGGDKVWELVDKWVWFLKGDEKFGGLVGSEDEVEEMTLLGAFLGLRGDFYDALRKVEASLG